jgi:hypothetical protein
LEKCPPQGLFYKQTHQEDCMKNAIKVLAIIVLVAVIGFSMAACGDKNDPVGTGGGGGELGAKLTAGSGKWVKDDGSGAYVHFKSTGNRGDGVLWVTYEVSDGIDLPYGNTDWELSGNTLNVSGGNKATITLHTDTTLTISGISDGSWFVFLNGNFTR